MALMAEDAQDRAEQLLLITERLTALIVDETERVEARQPPLEGAAAEEKNRLANAYRLELGRIKQDRSLIEPARPDTLSRLRRQTLVLHEALAAHELAVAAVKTVSEGLVHALAEEVARQRSGGLNYGAGGAPVAPSGPGPGLLDRTA